jgi:hypothetical protein
MAPREDADFAREAITGPLAAELHAYASRAIYDHAHRPEDHRRSLDNAIHQGILSFRFALDRAAHKRGREETMRRLDDYGRRLDKLERLEGAARDRAFEVAQADYHLDGPDDEFEDYLERLAGKGLPAKEGVRLARLRRRMVGYRNLRRKYAPKAAAIANLTADLERAEKALRREVGTLDNAPGSGARVDMLRLALDQLAKRRDRVIERHCTCCVRL